MARTTKTTLSSYLKWAGGKTRLIGAISKHIPAGSTRLVEPFAGSGVVALNLANRFTGGVVLSDANADLVATHNRVIGDTEAFIAELRKLFTADNNTADAYTRLRDEFNSTTDEARKASLFVYLNRHGFNGLCRYNKKEGAFNVAFGKNGAPAVPEKEIRSMAERLAGVTVARRDFREALATSVSGDFVVLDPPYSPLTETANFSSYAAGGFSEDDHRDLARLAREASERGATVLVFNHDTKFTRRLYDGASITGLNVSRSISANGSSRGKASEILAVYAPADKAKALDQCFTTPENATWMAKRVDEVLNAEGLAGSTLACVDPSAGGGALADAWEARTGQSVLRMDIDPKGDNVLRRDYLEWEPATDGLAGRKILFIQNGPFGKASSLAHKFTAHSMRHGTVVAEIVPRGLRSPHFVDSLQKNWRLAFDEDLPNDTFLRDGAEITAPCCLRVWIHEPGYVRPVWTDPSVGLFTVSLRDDTGAILTIRRAGANAGRFEDNVKPGSPTHMFIRPADGIDDKALRRAFETVDWKALATVSVKPGLSPYVVRSKGAEACRLAGLGAGATIQGATPAIDEVDGAGVTDAGSIVSQPSTIAPEWESVEYATDSERIGIARLRAARTVEGWIAGYDATIRIGTPARADNQQLADYLPAYATLAGALEDAVNAMLIDLATGREAEFEKISAWARGVLADADNIERSLTKHDWRAELSAPDGSVTAEVFADRVDGGWVPGFSISAVGKAPARRVARIDDAKSETLGIATEQALNALLRHVADANGIVDTFNIGVLRRAQAPASVCTVFEWLSDRAQSVAVAAGFVDGPMAGQTFLSFFSGMGGFEHALRGMGARCVGASENNPHAVENFERNHPGVPMLGDITKIDISKLPDVDGIVGGFPCQDVSIAGAMAGFDGKRSSLFFHLAKIISIKLPKWVILENVANLNVMGRGAVGTDGYNATKGALAFDVRETLAGLGYRVSTATLNAADFGDPQARVRVFICAVRMDLWVSGGMLPLNIPGGSTEHRTSVSEVLEPLAPAGTFSAQIFGMKDDRGESPEGTRLLGFKSARGSRKSSQTERVYSTAGCAPTTTKSHGSGWFKIDGHVRRLTPRECNRLNGFPEWHIPHASSHEATGQAGNSVSVATVRAVASAMAPYGAMQLPADVGASVATFDGRDAENDADGTHLPNGGEIRDTGVSVARSAILELDATAKLDKAQAKRMGKGTSPARVADALATMAFPDTGIPQSVIDPACGRGSLLVATVELVAQRLGSWDATAEWARKSLFGCDIDADAVADCNAVMGGLFASHGVEADLSENLRVDNFLAPSNGNPHPFADRVERFGSLLSNPPYVRGRNIDAETRDALRNGTVSCKGNFDMYFGFIERGLEISERSAFATPPGWMTGTSGKTLRSICAGRVSALADLGSVNPFPGLSTRCVLTAFGPTDCASWTVFSGLPGDETARVSVRPKDGLGTAPWTPFAEDTESRQEGTTLGSMADVLTGLCTQADDVFIFESEGVADGIHKARFKNGRRAGIETGVAVPFLKLTKPSLWNHAGMERPMCLMPHREDGTVIDMALLRQESPKASAWLRGNAKRLARRDGGKGHGHGFGRRQGIYPAFDSRDVLIGVPAMARDRLTTTRIDIGKLGSKRIAWTNGFVIRARDELQAQRIEAFLATDTAWKVLSARGSRFSEGWVGISAPALRSLIVPESARPLPATAANDEHHAVAA